MEDRADAMEDRAHAMGDRADSEMEEGAVHTAEQEGNVEEESKARESVAKRIKVRQDDRGSVRDFPTNLPMEYAYEGEKYYVRDCYPEYYELVMDLFKNEGIEGVTITGTPGIGKSVFMGYFFQRFSEEYSDAIILFASYDKTSVLKKVALAKGGTVVDQERDVATRMEEMMRGHGRLPGKHNIWLLDGPPTTIPDDVRWVSFTSPNESWKKKLAKEWRASIVYMPVWKLDELRDAAGKLGRNELLEPIDNDQLADLDLHPAKCIPRAAVIDARFQVFGGVARVCFGDQGFVQRSFDKLFQSINALTMHELAGAMASSDFSENVHRLIHFVPLTYE